MALLEKTSRAARASSLGPFAAGLAPLLYCAIGATAFMDLHAPDELIASVGGMSTGAPLTPSVLLAKLCALVPLGPLALRVSCASALALGFGARALHRSLDQLLRAQGVAHDLLREPIALGVTLFAFGTPLVLEQGLSPSGGALQLGLALFCLSRLSELEASWPSLDQRPLYSAAVAFGLLACADVRAALVLLPAALPTLSRLLHARGRGVLLRALGFSGLGLLWLGAATAFSSAGAGDAARDARALSVATPHALAQAYAHSLGAYAVIVALGAVAALQTPGVRRMAILWTCASLVPVLGYGLLAPSLTQPGLGAVTFALPAASMLAAALPGALLAPDGRPKPVASRAQLGAVLVLLVIGALRLHESAAQAKAPSAFRAELLEPLRMNAAAHTLVLSREAGVARALQALELEDRVRPELRVLPLAELEHDAAARKLAAREAELRPLVRAYLLDDELPRAELETLAASRPLVLDLDPHTPVALYDALRPEHGFFAVASANVSKTEERSAARDLLTELRARRERARRDPDDALARASVVDSTWAAALYFAGVGDRESARVALELARDLDRTYPRAQLAALLADPKARGPVDVRALVPRADD